MVNYLNLMARTVAALWHIGTRWISRLVRVALILIISHWTLVVLVSFTGVHELTVGASLLTVAALIFILVVASLPRYQDELGAALAVSATLSLFKRTRKILEKILKGLFLFLLIDAAFGLYFSLVPVENQRGAALWIIFFAAIFGMAVAVQPAARRQKIVNAFVFVLLVGSAAALFVVIPTTLANGGWDETKRDVARALKKDDAKAAPTGTPAPTTGKVIVLTEGRQYITLLGYDQLAGPVDLDPIADGECAKWRPSVKGVVIHWQDGSEESMGEESVHSPEGLVWFKGPAGYTVGVRKTADC